MRSLCQTGPGCGHRPAGRAGLQGLAVSTSLHSHEAHPCRAVACEVYEQCAAVAKQVLSENGLSDRVKATCLQDVRL